MLASTSTELKTMPDYTYQCNECGGERHVVHSIRQDPEITCEACGAPMTRVLGGVIFNVKGGRVKTDLDNQLRAKEAGEIKDAKELVRDFGASFRPRMRAAAEGAFGPRPKTPSDS
jgi:putative FmdB family regulatory protein